MREVAAITEERCSIIARGNGRVKLCKLAMRCTKKANGMDHLVILRALVKKEIGPGERTVILIVMREVVRDDDNGRRDHQSLDVSENFGAAAIPERGVQDCDIRFAVQNHRGGFVQVRRFSHDVHTGNFLKALLEPLAKVGICVREDDGHQMVSPGLTGFRVVHSLRIDQNKKQSAEQTRTVSGVRRRTNPHIETIGSHRRLFFRYPTGYSCMSDSSSWRYSTK